jgi:hypothetical protein
MLLPLSLSKDYYMILARIEMRLSPSLRFWRGFIQHHHKLQADDYKISALRESEPD